MTSTSRWNQKRTLSQSTLIRGLNNLILNEKKHFEQCGPPTEDKVIQINVDDQTHLKLISISESLSSTEKKDLISLIKEYIDVFAWSNEDMPGLDPQVAMHCLNIKLDAKLVKQQQ